MRRLQRERGLQAASSVSMCRCDRKLLRLRFSQTLITLLVSFWALWFMDHWSGSLRVHSGALLFTFSGCCPDTFMHPERQTNTWNAACHIKYLLSCCFYLFIFLFWKLHYLLRLIFLLILQQCHPWTAWKCLSSLSFRRAVLGSYAWKKKEKKAETLDILFMWAQH